MVIWRRCVSSVARQLGSGYGQQTHRAGVRSLIHHQGELATMARGNPLSSAPTAAACRQFLQQFNICSTVNLLAAEDTSMVPVSSPLTPPSGENLKTTKKDGTVKPSRVQAIKKDIRMSPKKLNLVAALVRGMRVEDALLQLQLTVKRAAKTVYQVIHSARANASHNHGLDADRLIVDEAFVGKGLYLKRLSYHGKGRSGVMVRPKCRLTVIVREITAEEEAKIAKLRISNYKKLTRKERQLMPHQLIEVRPRWGHKNKAAASTA